MRSRDDAKQLGQRLKERIVTTVFPHLARGFLEDHKRRLGIHGPPGDEELHDTYEATLTLLYRLLFLLYAESRDLLPMREAPYRQASLTQIKDEIAAKAGVAETEAAGRLATAYRADETTLYDRLLRLCEALACGAPALNVPIYQGGLFVAGPDESDGRLQRIARFLAEHKVPDRRLAPAIDGLARDGDDQTLGLAPIDYQALEVRHLGSIYEGLLDFTLKIAAEDLTTKTDGKREKYIPLATAKPVRGRPAEAVVRRGEVYLSNDQAERKASGSYYTPDAIVAYIVERTVGPVLAEKLEKLRPEFRKVLTYDAHRDLVDRLFDFRTLDPAMGSGHFLVEAVDFITDRLLSFLNQFPVNPVKFMLDRTRRNILETLGEQGVSVDPDKLTEVNLLKRHVLHHCIYGVDLNPMAVELAKVSLWLDAFTIGAPLSFLDHHLRCGNSLIGATFKDLENATGKQPFGSDYEPLLRAVRRVIEANRTADATAAAARHSAAQYAAGRRDLSAYQVLLDLLVAPHFGLPEAGEVLRLGANLDLSNQEQFAAAVAALRGGDVEPRKRAKKKALPPALVADVAALARRRDLRFFHWEIEFPEAYFGFADAGQSRLEHKERLAEGSAGFDAVVGNPPYEVLASKEAGADLSQLLAYFRHAPAYAAARGGKLNLYQLFVASLYARLRRGALAGMIVPMPLIADRQSAGLRRLLFGPMSLTEVDAFPEHLDASARVFEDANLTTCVFIAAKTPTRADSAIRLRVHRGPKIDDAAEAVPILADEIRRIDPDHLTIPNCGRDEWRIVTRLADCAFLEPLGRNHPSYQGEVNETTHRRFLGDCPGPLVLRGANICRYAVRDSWRSNDRRLDQGSFLRDGPAGDKAAHHRQPRVGFQRSAPQNNFRRLIAAPIGAGNFCFDTVSYFLPRECKLGKDLLLGLLNSEFLDWYFDIGSTNSKINAYRLNRMPVPRFATSPGPAVDEDLRGLLAAEQWGEIAAAACRLIPSPESRPAELPASVAEVLARLVGRVCAREKKRQLQSHHQRSRLADGSRPIQAAIDDIVFACYAVTADERVTITESLNRRRGRGK